MTGFGPLSMAALDAMPPAAFVATLGDLFEHSPWVVQDVAAERPFGTARQMHKAMMDRLRAAGTEAQRAVIVAHPELAGREAADGGLTDASTGEQGRLGFDRLSGDEYAAMTELNAAYRARFGFPCIVALTRHTARETVHAAMRARLNASPAAEHATALAEIGHITEARLTCRLGRTKGAMTIHALDTVRGGAAAELAFALHAERPGGWVRLLSGTTNTQGRTDTPLLAGLDLEPGAYRVDCAVGAYHRARGEQISDPAFLEIVSVGFGVSDPGAHYHVPIQFTPWSYAIYRGS